MDSGCSYCGFKEDPVALHFHHLNKNKKSFSISQKMSCSMRVILKEIKKCKVLCANCHSMEEHRTNKDAIY